MRGRAARFVLGSLMIFAGSVPIVAPMPPAGGAAVSEPPPLAPLPRVDPRSRSLSPAGQRLIRDADLDDAPRSSVSAAVDPGTGRVEGRYRARIARPRDGELRFRMLAGLPAFHAGLEVRDATVDGREADVRRDDALLIVPVDRGLSGTAEIRLRFSYRVPRGDETVGRFLTPATIGLLSRSRDVMLLGHWFPLWIPPDADADPDLSGYGDVGNFAAGAITVRVEVPSGYDVYGAGTTLAEHAGDETTVVTESGVGLRDLSLVVARGMTSAEVKIGDVTVRATAPTGTDPQPAAADVAASLEALQLLFGPYPWSELDELDVPLGPQVGGMEWPGAIWIDGFGTDTDGGVDSVVAHEVAHEYWHALVGNDSLAASVVDEPLAQYSACLIVQVRAAGASSGACRFGGRVSPGAPRPCIDRPTDAFEPGEYGDLVYGEAPAFYERLAELIGQDATVAALRAVIDRHAFGVITTEELRDELANAAPERSDEIRALWDETIGPPGCWPTR